MVLRSDVPILIRGEVVSNHYLFIQTDNQNCPQQIPVSNPPTPPNNNNNNTYQTCSFLTHKFGCMCQEALTFNKPFCNFYLNQEKDLFSEFDENSPVQLSDFKWSRWNFVYKNCNFPLNTLESKCCWWC